MGSKSLKFKIYSIGILPFLFFILSVSYITYSEISQYNEIQQLFKKFEMIDLASKVVHETQIERGKSASYLSGGEGLSGLQSQWQKNNNGINDLLNYLPQSNFPTSLNNEIRDMLNSYKDM